MKIKMYQVDAFTTKLFGGNPAAVCILNSWLDNELMQSIAAENNLAETAFIVKNDTGYDIRWFTPAVEVDLCGHATLASAHVVFNYLNHPSDELTFLSPRSGRLNVNRNGKSLTLDFPTDVFEQVQTPAVLTQCFGNKIIETFKGKTDHRAVFATEDEIVSIVPDLNALSKLAGRGLIVTAPGKTVDFVSRFFAPQSGINEDPVTGSAHTTLTPYWAKKFGKNELTAIQLSERKGHLHCKYDGDRVEISGYAVTYLQGEIEVG